MFILAKMLLVNLVQILRFKIAIFLCYISPIVNHTTSRNNAKGFSFIIFFLFTTCAHDKNKICSSIQFKSTMLTFYLVRSYRGFDTTYFLSKLLTTWRVNYIYIYIYMGLEFNLNAINLSLTSSFNQISIIRSPPQLS